MTVTTVEEMTADETSAVARVMVAGAEGEHHEVAVAQRVVRIVAIEDPEEGRLARFQRHAPERLLDPKRLSRDELDAMVREPGFVQVFDWLDSYVLRKHPEREPLRQRWLDDSDPWAARAGWSLTAERIGKQPEGLDLAGLLDRIESEMGAAPPETQWTMNNSLAGIGIHHAPLRERAVAIGEELGVFRDYPTPKGCTSPFAPIWITEIVGRGEGV